MKREEIDRLLARFSSGEITPEERALLFEAALEDQSLFDELYAEMALADALSGEGMKEEVLEALAEAEPAVPAEGRGEDAARGRKFPWWGWTVPAAVAASMAVGFVLLRQPVSGPETAQTKPAKVAEIAQSQPAAAAADSAKMAESEAGPAPGSAAGPSPGPSPSLAPKMRESDAAREKGAAADESRAKTDLAMARTDAAGEAARSEEAPAAPQAARANQMIQVQEPAVAQDRAQSQQAGGAFAAPRRQSSRGPGSAGGVGVVTADQPAPETVRLRLTAPEGATVSNIPLEERARLEQDARQATAKRQDSRVVAGMERRASQPAPAMGMKAVADAAKEKKAEPAMRRTAAVQIYTEAGEWVDLAGNRAKKGARLRVRVTTGEDAGVWTLNGETPRAVVLAPGGQGYIDLPDFDEGRHALDLVFQGAGAAQRSVMTRIILIIE